MLFVVRFYDKPEMAPVRQQYTAAHREFLKANSAVRLIPGTLPGGSMWIVKARDVGEVMVWNRAFSEETVLIADAE